MTFEFRGRVNCIRLSGASFTLLVHAGPLSKNVTPSSLKSRRRALVAVDGSHGDCWVYQCIDYLKWRSSGYQLPLRTVLIIVGVNDSYCMHSLCIPFAVCRLDVSLALGLIDLFLC